MIFYGLIKLLILRRVADTQTGPCAVNELSPAIKPLHTQQIGDIHNKSGSEGILVCKDFCLHIYIQKILRSYTLRKCLSRHVISTTYTNAIIRQQRG